MSTHISPSFYPYVISLFLSLFFICLVYSVNMKSNLVLFFFFFFFTVSINFFFYFKSELEDFSVIQYFLNSQYFYFFIFSEFCFFFGVFWAVFWGFYSYDYYNVNYLSSNLGILLIYPYALPLLNTFLLLTSACFATIFHELFIDSFYDNTLIICFFFGLVFLSIQYVEFFSAPYNINYTSFGSLFFFSTGFHGFHVLLGLFFMSIFIVYFYNFHGYILGYLNVSLLYWHFVDVVWLFLFIFVYVLVY